MFSYLGSKARGGLRLGQKLYGAISGGLSLASKYTTAGAGIMGAVGAFGAATGMAVPASLVAATAGVTSAAAASTAAHKIDQGLQGIVSSVHRDAKSMLEK